MNINDTQVYTEKNLEGSLSRKGVVAKKHLFNSVKILNGFVKITNCLEGKENGNSNHLIIKFTPRLRSLYASMALSCRENYTCEECDHKRNMCLAKTIRRFESVASIKSRKKIAINDIISVPDEDIPLDAINKACFIEFRKILYDFGSKWK
jgi:hypothetical protein